MEKDPVCNMKIDPKTATEKSVYKGQEYYFCSSDCKNNFDLDPEKYIHNEHNMHGCCC
jgi:YHS domain-containing protein